MKKILSLLLTACCIVVIAVIPAKGAQAEEEAAPSTGVTINVYNWGEYISNGSDGTLDVNEEFTRRTGIPVSYTHLDVYKRQEKE